MVILYQPPAQLYLPIEHSYYIFRIGVFWITPRKITISNCWSQNGVFRISAWKIMWQSFVGRKLSLLTSTALLISIEITYAPYLIRISMKRLIPHPDAKQVYFIFSQKVPLPCVPQYSFLYQQTKEYFWLFCNYFFEIKCEPCFSCSYHQIGLSTVILYTCQLGCEIII